MYAVGQQQQQQTTETYRVAGWQQGGLETRNVSVPTPQVYFLFLYVLFALTMFYLYQTTKLDPEGPRRPTIANEVSTSPQQPTQANDSHRKPTQTQGLENAVGCSRLQQGPRGA